MGSNLQPTIWKKKSGKYYKICPTKKEFPNYVIKRGMMRFTVGRSLFSNKIFATTQGCALAAPGCLRRLTFGLG